MPFAGNQRALQRVGKQVGQRYDDGRNAEGNLQAVAEQPVEILAAHQLLRRHPATALPGLTAEMPRQKIASNGSNTATPSNTSKRTLPPTHKDPVADLGTRSRARTLLVR
jgi:hypothetical protein